MRYELQAILWVSAALLLANVLFFSAPTEHVLSSHRLGDLPYAAPGKSTPQIAKSAESAQLPLDKIAKIFGPDIEKASETTEQTREISRDRLALLGLVLTDGIAKALLSAGESTPILLSAGEEAFGYVVEDVESDRIVVRDRSNFSLETIMLRGAYETSE